MSANNDWHWPREMDAVAAAPESHRVLFKNDLVRVLEVSILPGNREPEHTHRMPGVLIVDSAAVIRYYEAGVLLGTSGSHASGAAISGRWLEPEGPHSVENADIKPYHAFRFEIATSVTR